jgi:hypothetical protein
MAEAYRICAVTMGNETRFQVCVVDQNSNGTVTCAAPALTETFVSVDAAKLALDRMLTACDLPVLPVSRTKR